MSLVKGDIVSFQVMGKSMLLVSSAEVAFDLMEKRSAIYSSKPYMVIDELWVAFIALVSYYELYMQFLLQDGMGFQLWDDALWSSVAKQKENISSIL
jgi:hypothetical protein